MNHNQNMKIKSQSELNKYKNENINLRKQIHKLQLENNKLKQNLQITQRSLLNYNYQIQNLNNKLKNKEKELNNLKKNIKNNFINQGNKKKYVDFNKIIVINFISGDGKINYGIKCLKTDTFAEVEEKLYQIYEEYRESNNIFLAGGKVVLRFKTIEQNKIRDGEKVQLQNF